MSPPLTDTNAADYISAVLTLYLGLPETTGQREAHISFAVPICTRRPVQRLERLGQE
jgi:hypothetical protein